MPSAPKLVAIYGLYDPRTDALRYIGKAKDPARRRKGHLRRSALNLPYPVARWCKELVAQGLEPRQEVLTWARDWEMAERRLIAAHRKAGADLLNLAAGGVDIPPRANKIRPTTPTSLLYRSAMGELARVRGMVQPSQANVVAGINELMKGIRGARALLLRKGKMYAAIAFDVNLWAHFVQGTPLDWYMTNMEPVPNQSAEYRKAVMDGVRATLARYGLLPPLPGPALPPGRQRRSCPTTAQMIVNVDRRIALLNAHAIAA